MSSTVRLLFFAGSARRDSHNKRLARLGATIAEANGIQATFADLGDYPMPLYDGDTEVSDGPPPNAVKLKHLMGLHTGICIASPEYNSSITPLLKNTLDWISRVGSDQHGKLVPYRGKIFAIASASPGAYGGIRGLNHLRAILVNVGALVLTEQLAVAKAETAFDGMDQLVDQRTAGFLDTMVHSIVEKAALFARH